MVAVRLAAAYSAGKIDRARWGTSHIVERFTGETVDLGSERTILEEDLLLPRQVESVITIVSWLSIGNTGILEIHITSSGGLVATFCLGLDRVLSFSHNHVGRTLHGDCEITG